MNGRGGADDRIKSTLQALSEAEARLTQARSDDRLRGFASALPALSRDLSNVRSVLSGVSADLSRYTERLSRQRSALAAASQAEARARSAAPPAQTQAKSAAGGQAAGITAAAAVVAARAAAGPASRIAEQFAEVQRRAVRQQEAAFRQQQASIAPAEVGAPPSRSRKRPGGTSAGPGPLPADFESMTIPQLRALAGQRGVDLPSGGRKAELQEILRTHAAASSQPALPAAFDPARYGAGLSRRADEMASRSARARQRLSAEGDLLEKAVLGNVAAGARGAGTDARAADLAGTPGDKEKRDRQAREQARETAAARRRQSLEEALAASARRRMIGDNAGGGADAYEREALSRYASEAENAQLRLAEAKAKRLIDLGGPQLQGAAAQEARGRQQESIDADLRADRVEAARLTQRQVAVEQRRQAMLRSPEGKRQLQEELRLRQQLEKESGKSQWLQARAEKGPLGAAMDAFGQKLQKAQEQMQSFASAGAAAFAGVTTGVLASVSAADGFVTFPTLIESARSVMISLGESFIPVVNEISSGLQGMAGWVRGLSDGTKLWATRVVLWVGAGGAAVAMVYRLVAALNALRTASLANPWTAGLTLAVGVVGALASEYYLLGNNASYAAQMVGGVADAAGRATGLSLKSQSGVKADDVAGLPAPVRAAIERQNFRPAETRAILDAYRQQIEAQLEGAKAVQVPGLAQRQKLDERVSKAMGDDLFQRAEQYRRTTEGEVGALQRFRERSGFFARSADDLKRWLGDGSAPQLPEDARARRDAAAADLAAKLLPDAVARVEKAGVKTFDPLPEGRDAMPDAEVARRRAAGEVSVRDIAERLRLGALSDRGASAYKQEMDPRRFEALRATERGDRKLKELEDRLQQARDLTDKSGRGMDMAVKYPVQPAVMDASAYSDRITVAGLKGDDLTNKNLEAQLKNSQESLHGILDMANTSREIKAMLQQLQNMNPLERSR